MFKNKPYHQLTFKFAVSLLLLTFFKTSAQVVLPDESLPFEPTEFYVAGVFNKSADQNAAFIRRYLLSSLPRNRSLRPVTITIRELKLREIKENKGRVKGAINLYLSYGLQKAYGVEHLVEYNGKLNFIRSAADSAAISRHLRSIAKSGLVYFNNWIKANVNSNRKLAKNVTISFSDYAEQLEGDTIYYNAQRPLTWADFKSRNPASSRFQAVVLPGFGYNQEAKMSNGTIHVHLAVKTFLPKSAAWAAHTGRDTYALNHEQRHFDIVKIISEQFKHKLLAKELTPDNFEALINIQYLDSYRDMNVMQKAYDKETSNGMNRSAQLIWNDRIDKELLKVSNDLNRMLP